MRDREKPTMRITAELTAESAEGRGDTRLITQIRGNEQKHRNNREGERGAEERSQQD